MSTLGTIDGPGGRNFDVSDLRPRAAYSDEGGTARHSG